MKFALAPVGASLALGLAALTTAPAAFADNHKMIHPNSIQPETTLNISADGMVQAEPDIAFITTGVQTEAKTAAAALSDNAERMNALFAVLEDAGIAERDIQTSNFSRNPKYNYPERRAPVLVGFTVSNQVTVRVRDLDELGGILDTVVEAGGNQFGGLSFAVDADSDLRDDARAQTMKPAVTRAKLYADAAGYEIARIVTIDEGGNYSPQPVRAMVRMQAKDSMESAPSPIASGELTFRASVSVQFELTKK